jgi:hypothetical protein
MIAKDGIAVPQQVAREWGKVKCLPQLRVQPAVGVSRAKFSSWRAARERKIEDRVARSVAREMSIRGE